VLVSNTNLLVECGFETGLKPKIEKRLMFLDQEVNIYDETLTNVLHSGTFKGLNEFGHALIVNESDG